MLKTFYTIYKVKYISFTEDKNDYKNITWPLLCFSFSIGFGTGLLCGGLVYDTYGGRNLFRAAGAMCAATFLIMVVIQLVLRRRRSISLSIQYEPI